MNVYFPLTSGTESRSTSTTEEGELRGGTETILAVEDEPAVSNLVVQILRSQGYTVLEARDGRRALDVWRRHRGKIDLVLSDVVMPNMGGVALFRELRQQDPDLPILFASGYTDEALTGLQELGEEIDLLEKPFTTENLVRRVRRALDRHRW